MWLKCVKGSLLGLSLFAGLASFASSVSAVTVTIDGTDVGLSQSVTIEDANETPDPVVIKVDEAGDYLITLALGGVAGPITGVNLDGTETFTEESGGVFYTLVYTFAAGTEYTINTSLSSTGTGVDYQISLSAVPLPAAAWMFLSMLFGGAWIKRRSVRSKGSVVATA